MLCYRVDVCHQGNGEEEDEDDEESNSIQQGLLEKTKIKPGSSSASDRRKCCSFHGIHLGTRQKFVVAVYEILLFCTLLSHHSVSFTNVFLIFFFWLGGCSCVHLDDIICYPYLDCFR